MVNSRAMSEILCLGRRFGQKSSGVRGLSCAVDKITLESEMKMRIPRESLAIVFVSTDLSRTVQITPTSHVRVTVLAEVRYTRATTYEQRLAEAEVAILYTESGVKSIHLFIPSYTRVDGNFVHHAVDETSLPPNLKTFLIKGHNRSLEKTIFPYGLESVDVGDSLQPIYFLNTPLSVRAPHIEGGKHVDGVSADGMREGATRFSQKYSARLEKVEEVVLDDAIRTLGDVWTDVLFEGRVVVRDLVTSNDRGWDYVKKLPSRPLGHIQKVITDCYSGGLPI